MSRHVNFLWIKLFTDFLRHVRREKLFFLCEFWMDMSRWGKECTFLLENGRKLRYWRPNISLSSKFFLNAVTKLRRSQRLYFIALVNKLTESDLALSQSIALGFNVIQVLLMVQRDCLYGKVMILWVSDILIWDIFCLQKFCFELKIVAVQFLHFNLLDSELFFENRVRKM
jgi:hypothetical protein